MRVFCSGFASKCTYGETEHGHLDAIYLDVHGQRDHPLRNPAYATQQPSYSQMWQSFSRSLLR